MSFMKVKAMHQKQELLPEHWEMSHLMTTLTSQYNAISIFYTTQNTSIIPNNVCSTGIKKNAGPHDETGVLLFSIERTIVFK